MTLYMGEEEGQTSFLEVLGFCANRKKKRGWRDSLEMKRDVMILFETYD